MSTTTVKSSLRYDPLFNRSFAELAERYSPRVANVNYFGLQSRQLSSSTRVRLRSIL